MVVCLFCLWYNKTVKCEVFFMRLKAKKDIFLIITYIAFIIFGLVNFDKIINVFAFIINIFYPFIIGTVLAFILNVLVNFVERRLLGKVKNTKCWKKVKRPVSILISVVIIILILVFVMNLIIPQLKNSLSLFTDTLPEYKDDVIVIMNRFNIEEGTITTVSEYFDNFSKIITDYIKGNSKDVISMTTEFASSIFDIVSSTVIAIVFAIYIIAQKETLVRQMDKIMRAFFKPGVIKKVYEATTLANRSFSNFITGQCLEAFIIGTLCFIGMVIFKIPYASTVSVLIGFCALIPIFGSIIGTILGAFLILMVNPVEAIVFVVFIIILQQIDNNFIYPRVVGKSIGLPGMWVLVSVTVGGKIYGILGMLIATPLCSMLYILFSKFVNTKLRREKIAIKVEEKKA